MQGLAIFRLLAKDEGGLSWQHSREDRVGSKLMRPNVAIFSCGMPVGWSCTLVKNLSVEDSLHLSTLVAWVPSCRVAD